MKNCHREIERGIQVFQILYQSSQSRQNKKLLQSAATHLPVSSEIYLSHSFYVGKVASSSI